ncbi:DUF4249 domain-containing protein [Flagellimonas sp.]|uniref:DUF4249 domain-containing protein n=1 Tax=Flagellimonas sp. TaxID=2058762 RepID=UPI003F4A67DC
MRKASLLFAAAFIFFACEDVIDVDLSTSEPRLVIDALIGFNSRNGDPITVGQVKLTLTAPFFDEEVPPALNASVSIIDEETGEAFELGESEPGVFTIGFPELQFNRDYTLSITYEGEIYTATERLNASPVIDNAVQGDGFLFDEEEETEVIITFTDIPGERNNYLFSFGFDNFLVIEDEFFQDSEITFSYFYEDVEPGDLLPITLFGIDDEFATYAELVLTQSGEDGGGPFATPPATIKGNIVNTTNSDNFPFGYFAISEFDARFITVTE